MDLEKFIKNMNENINKNGNYSTNVFSNRISFRQGILRGTLSFEVGEFVNGVVAIVIDLVNKEDGDKFIQVADEILKSFFKELPNQLKEPYVLIGATSLISKWKDVIESCKLIKLTEEELRLVNIEEDGYESAEWAYRSKDDIFFELLPALKQFELDFNDLVKHRRTSQEDTNYYYKPFQQKVLTCDFAIEFSLKSLSPIKFKLNEIGNEYVYETSAIKKPATHLFEEFLESMKLKLLVSNDVLSSAISLSSTHCRGNIREGATSLQQFAYENKWNFDDMDIIFRILTSDTFNDQLDAAQSSPGKELMFEDKGFKIKIKSVRSSTYISMGSEEYDYKITAANGFPFKVDEVKFEKNLKYA